MRRPFSKIFIATLMLMISFTSVHAQYNMNFLNLDVGVNYYHGLEATISYEHGSKYHNSWEYFLTYHLSYDKDPEVGHMTIQSFWNNYNTLHIGAAYKPCVIRRRNNHGNLRIGASIGSNVNDFLSDFSTILGGVHLGYEHSFALYHGWELFLQVKEDVMFPKRNGEIFRTGAAIGFKIPLNSSTYRP